MKYLACEEMYVPRFACGDNMEVCNTTRPVALWKDQDLPKALLAVRRYEADLLQYYCI